MAYRPRNNDYCFYYYSLLVLLRLNVTTTSECIARLSAIGDFWGGAVVGSRVRE